MMDKYSNLLQSPYFVVTPSPIQIKNEKEGKLKNIANSRYDYYKETAETNILFMTVPFFFLEDKDPRVTN
jgi:hypothetical protein